MFDCRLYVNELVVEATPWNQNWAQISGNQREFEKKNFK